MDTDRDSNTLRMNVFYSCMVLNLSVRQGKVMFSGNVYLTSWGGPHWSTAWHALASHRLHGTPPPPPPTPTKDFQTCSLGTPLIASRHLTWGSSSLSLSPAPTKTPPPPNPPKTVFKLVHMGLHLSPSRQPTWYSPSLSLSPSPSLSPPRSIQTCSAL